MADACAGCLVSKTRLCLKNLFLNIITLKIERKKEREKEKRGVREVCKAMTSGPSVEILCPYHLPFAKLKRKENIFIDGESSLSILSYWDLLWRIRYTILICVMLPTFCHINRYTKDFVEIVCASLSLSLSLSLLKKGNCKSYSTILTKNSHYFYQLREVKYEHGIYF